MQAGGARGAIGEAGGRPRCHPASSACSVAPELHVGHLEGSREPGSDSRARIWRCGTLRLGGQGPCVLLPAPRRLPPIGQQSGTPRRRSQTERGADPQEPGPGQPGDALPVPQLSGLPAAVSGRIRVPRVPSHPPPKQLGCPVHFFSGPAPAATPEARRDLRASQHRHSVHILKIYLFAV